MLATPPSIAYLAVKFVRRHPTGVGVGTALALTVFMGSGVSVWQAVRASRQAALAEARRGEADSSREVATIAQRQAEFSVKEVSHQLARHYVDNGVQRLEEGDYSLSWIWFAEALRLDQGDPMFEMIHRQRLGALSRPCPPLLQLFAHSNFVFTAEFSADGRRLLTGTLDQATRIWDVDTGQPVTPALPHGGVGNLQSRRKTGGDGQ